MGVDGADGPFMPFDWHVVDGATERIIRVEVPGDAKSAASMSIFMRTIGGFDDVLDGRRRPTTCELIKAFKSMTGTVRLWLR